MKQKSGLSGMISHGREEKSAFLIVKAVYGQPYCLECDPILSNCECVSDSMMLTESFGKDKRTATIEVSWSLEPEFLTMAHSVFPPCALEGNRTPVKFCKQLWKRQHSIGSCWQAAQKLEIPTENPRIFSISVLNFDIPTVKRRLFS